MIRQTVIALLSAVFCSTPVCAKDPKVPPAQDPGLVPVALVGDGVDYTDAALAPRLARDGEGNIIGWDFVDNDIFPYATSPASNADAKLLLTNPGVELAPVRIAANDFRGVAGAASFVSHTPARTVVVTLTSERKEDWEFFVKASQVFPKLLFVVPAGSDKPVFPASLDLDNVLSVATPALSSVSANIVFEPGAGRTSSSDAAILAAAAIATCHAGIAGHGDGKSRKAAILAKFASASAGAARPVVPPCP